MSDKPRIVTQMLCNDHIRDLIENQLGMEPEADGWVVCYVMAQIAITQLAASDPRIHKRTGGDGMMLSTIFAELGCLACFESEWYRRAVKLLKKGKSHAAQVTRGLVYDPEWVFTEEQVAAMVAKEQGK